MPRTTLIFLLAPALLCGLLAGCPTGTSDDDASDDDTADDDAGDDDAADDDTGSDDDSGDDDSTPPDGPYGVVVDQPLEFDGAPLRLTRLDAALGGDGRVHFTGYDGAGRVATCSFDATFVGHLPQEKGSSLDLQCQDFEAGALFFTPRIAVDPSGEPAVVWDQTSNTETHARYLGTTQLLMDAPPETPSVNHPDICYYDGGFTAVSQWYWAIGRTDFVSLPATLQIEPDWDAGPGGSEHKAPSIAAHGDGTTERQAWVSYHGDSVHLKTRTTDETAIVDRSFLASTVTVDSTPLQGYPGWPHVAVDSALGIHIAWHSWFDTVGGGQYRAVDYRHLSHPGLTEVASITVDVPIGDGTWHSPAVAVNGTGDVIVAFASAIAGDSAVYLLLRDVGEPAFEGPPQPLEEHRPSGLYQPAAAGYEGSFWVLYNDKAQEQVHALRLDRGP